VTILFERKVPTYVASPYGFADSTRSWYYGTLIPLLERHVQVLDPWAEVPLTLSADTSATDRWFELGCRHLDNIKNNAQLLVAGLDQEPPDTGTVVELAWAAAHDIPVIGYRSDLRTSGEAGLKYNLMVGSVIRRSGGIEVSDLASLQQQVGHYAATLAGR
jgi:nucleoside 2-deoxyribosyltransferase